jgi:alcohol dehydrogenase class IV
MDAQQPAAAISLGQALAVLWPYLSAAGAVVAFLVGWIRSLALKLASFDKDVSANRARIERLEKADTDQDDATKEQKSKLHDRIDELEARFDQHTTLEEHQVGKVRRELMAAQLDEVRKAVTILQDGVNRLLAKAGA